MFTSTITAVAQLEKPSLQAAATGSEILVKDQGDLDIKEQGYGKLLDLHGIEFIIPNYTIKEIYDAIPRECFERNVFKSSTYLIQDLTLIAFTLFGKNSPYLQVLSHVYHGACRVMCNDLNLQTKMLFGAILI